MRTSSSLIRALRPLPVACFLIGLLLVWNAPAAQSQADAGILAPSGAWVTDEADLLTDSEEQALTAKLRAYADTTSSQIIIVTVPDLGGRDAAGYAIELGEQWGVGQRGRDNGVVVLVSRDDRQIFIAIGKGLEGAIPDVVAGRIRRDIMAPAFRQGQFYGGLAEAVDALVAAAAGEFEAEAVKPRGEGISLTTVLILMIVIFFLIRASRGGGGGRGGRRYRSHPGIPPFIIWGGSGGFGGGGGGGFGGFGGGGFGGGGFGGGGGSFGGGGAGGSW